MGPWVNELGLLTKFWELNVIIGTCSQTQVQDLEQKIESLKGVVDSLERQLNAKVQSESELAQSLDKTTRERNDAVGDFNIL